MQSAFNIKINLRFALGTLFISFDFPSMQQLFSRTASTDLALLRVFTARYTFDF